MVTQILAIIGGVAVVRSTFMTGVKVGRAIEQAKLEEKEEKKGFTNLFKRKGVTTEFNGVH